MPSPPKRTPGAGLGFVFPADEAPTVKRSAVPDERVACPMCGGRKVLRISAYIADERCPTCRGEGTVTRSAGETFILEHPGSLAAQLARKKKT